MTAGSAQHVLGMLRGDGARLMTWDLTLIAADLVPASHLVGEGGDPGPRNRTWTRSLKKALDECRQPVRQSTSADSTRRRRSRDLPGAKKKDDRTKATVCKAQDPPPQPGLSPWK